MSTIDDVLKSIKSDVPAVIKDQLKDLLTSAVEDTDSVIKETGQKLKDWLLMLAEGKISNEEFEALLYSRDQLVRQYKNTLEIQARARVEKIALALINLISEKIFRIPFGTI